MKVIGLSGSLAAGKTTAVGMLRRLRLPVWEADKAVHELMARDGKAAAAIVGAFGSMVANLETADGINRPALRKYVFADYTRLQRLEAIIHPHVAAARRDFLRKCHRCGCKLAALDIPLLFEKGGYKRCDLAILIRAPKVLTRRRIAARGLDPATARSILARQLPDHAKAKLADVVINSGLGKLHTLRGLKRALRLVGGADQTSENR